MARVPSGEPSSTIISSQSRLLGRRGALVWRRFGVGRGYRKE